MVIVENQKNQISVPAAAAQGKCRVTHALCAKVLENASRA